VKTNASKAIEATFSNAQRCKKVLECVHPPECSVCQGGAIYAPLIFPSSSTTLGFRTRSYNQGDRKLCCCVYPLRRYRPRGDDMPMGIELHAQPGDEQRRVLPGIPESRDISPTAKLHRCTVVPECFLNAWQHQPTFKKRRSLLSRFVSA